jgi:hypothetical protein
LNALTHGLTSELALLHDEDRAEQEVFAQRLRDADHFAMTGAPVQKWVAPF